MSIITVNDHLTETLLGKTRRSLLSVLYGHADETFYLRQLVRVAGSGTGAVQRELKALTEAGIIRRIVKGRQVYYQANALCAVYPELKSLITKTAGMGDALKMAMLPLAERILTAFIYGSVARSGERRGSDVDIFLVGDVTSAEVVETLSPVQLTLNREINPTVYPVEEFRAKYAAGHHFLKSVLEEKKVFLIGDENDLAKLAS
ncbi:MAG: nucleotidyltransferase domain-containing protein [Syntrophales bacterium]|nr:nucleotidyltransferase domain-containing protein [Syntrophales bacterium]